MATVRESGLSFLHEQLRWVETFADDYPEGAPWPERDGRVAGGVGALLAAGVIDAAEADAWRARLSGAGDGVPAADAGVRAQGEALLAELLEAVPPDDEDGVSAERDHFDGAVGALAAIGAVDGRAWDDRLRARLGWPSWEEELARMGELSAGGTEEELVAVLPGSEEVDGVRVLYALRFADGISFLVHGAIGREWHLAALRDDVGTHYTPGGSGGSDVELRIAFRTAPPPQARWVELSGPTSRPLRVGL